MKKKLAVFSLEKKRNIYGDDDYYVLGSLESIFPIGMDVEKIIEKMEINEGVIVTILPIYTKD